MTFSSKALTGEHLLIVKFNTAESKPGAQLKFQAYNHQILASQRSGRLSIGVSGHPPKKLVKNRQCFSWKHFFLEFKQSNGTDTSLHLLLRWRVKSSLPALKTYRPFGHLFPIIRTGALAGRFEQFRGHMGANCNLWQLLIIFPRPLIPRARYIFDPLSNPTIHFLICPI